VGDFNEPTLRDLLALYIRQRIGLSKNYCAVLTSYVNSFEKFAGGPVALSRIAADSLADFMRYSHVMGLSPYSTNDRRTKLLMLCKFAAG
jgi:hypothetical protein